MLPRGSVAGDDAPPTRAVAPKPITVSGQARTAPREETAQDIARRTWRALPAVYMRMVTCGRTGAARRHDGAAARLIMSRPRCGPLANWRPESQEGRSRAAVAPARRVEQRAAGSSRSVCRISAATRGPSRSSITDLEDLDEGGALACPPIAAYPIISAPRPDDTQPVSSASVGEAEDEREQLADAGELHHHQRHQRREVTTAQAVDAHRAAGHPAGERVAHGEPARVAAAVRPAGTSAAAGTARC